MIQEPHTVQPLTIEEISTALSAHRIRPSVQRIRIYQYLCENRNHPTADTVFSALHPAIPTLSRTTVYNTLKLFESRHLVQTVIIEDNGLRFDADTSAHMHFKCHGCGRIFDVPLKNQPAAVPDGFIADKIQLNVWGVCKDCAGSV